MTRPVFPLVAVALLVACNAGKDEGDPTPRPLDPGVEAGAEQPSIPLPDGPIPGSEPPMPDISKPLKGGDPAMPDLSAVRPPDFSTPAVARQSSGVLAAGLVRAEWSKAENRKACAPIVFTTDAGAPGIARPVNFAGGWAVAFDTPSQRSAYGIGGAGLTDADRGPVQEQTDRLARQWPYFVQLKSLPAMSFAGYGQEGARPFPDDNPEGYGLNALAYVRVGAQTCTYNVWSRLGRAHLEALLASLRKL